MIAPAGMRRLLIGAVKAGLAVFNAEGTGAALATVATLAVLCLVLPSFTTSSPGPQYTSAQLTFAAVASLALHAMFVVTQTVRHRDFFLHVGHDGHDVEDVEDVEDVDEHSTPPTTRAAVASVMLLLIALVAVVGLAKVESPAIESGVWAAGLPQSFVGVVIALVVLLPETLAAVRAALRGRVQVSLNLAVGSAIASIGLTIPAVALATIWLPGRLVLGLDPTQITLLAITVAVGTLTVVPGPATRLHAGLHLVLLAAFVFLAASP